MKKKNIVMMMCHLGGRNLSRSGFRYGYISGYGYNEYRKSSLAGNLP